MNIKRFNWLMVVGLVVIGIIAARSIPHDTTDPEDGRSGLSLYTDALTGCQYLRVGFFGTLVPRMYMQQGYLLTHRCLGVAE